MNDKVAHVLVVDDENTIRDLLKQLLELNNYRVTTASNGQEALEIYKTNRDNIDLVITDLGLPQLNGKKLGEKIKALNPDAKMIIATGFADQNDHSALMDIGFLYVVSKPFDIREMINTVERALEK
ncbi:MAG: response regulator [Candidatus Marinimicrobia bacterium]|nr:response regulator [Candidatus Neomarinimicrobiota bacterium]MCF7840418.1 response regulator [Candidatus Neomarinimicrobiota bacterium]